MTTIIAQLHHFMRSERGATAIEYSMIAALVILAIIAAIGALGTGVAGLYGKIQSAL